MQSCLVTLPLIRMFLKHSKSRGSWGLDSLFCAKGDGILEEKASDLELTRNWLKLLKVGKRVWSPKHGILEADSKFLCHS